MRNRRLIEFARKLRKEATEAERLLWELLRSRRFSRFKIRRQHVVGEFVVDFYCAKARLAIEIDGGGHRAKRQALYDEYRTAELQDRGIRVIRFWNHEVLHETESVLAEIHRELKGASKRR